MTPAAPVKEERLRETSREREAERERERDRWSVNLFVADWYMDTQTHTNRHLDTHEKI